MTKKTTPEDVLSRCTDRARKALLLADDERRKRGDKYIATEHILIALAKAGGVAQTVLENIGLGTKEIREDVNILLQTPSGTEANRGAHR